MDYGDGKFTQTVQPCEQCCVMARLFKRGVRMCTKCYIWTPRHDECSGVLIGQLRCGDPIGQDARRAIYTIFIKKIGSSRTAEASVSEMKESILTFNLIFIINYTFEIRKDLVQQSHCKEGRRLNVIYILP